MSPIRMSASIAGLTLASALVLTGCAGLVENAVDSAVDKAAEEVAENVAENAIEQAIEADSGLDADIDLGLDGSGASVPSDFPSEVPLPDGLDLQTSMKASGGFSLIYAATDRSKIDAYVAKFDSWEETFASDMGEMRTWGFQGADWSVSLGDIMSSSDDQAMLTLTVTPITQ